MKKLAISLLLVLALIFALSSFAFADHDNWNAMPTITHVYEFSKEKIALEWEGNADLYQIYVDGKTVATVNINTAIISMKAGSHQIVVVPIKYESKNVDTRVDIDISFVSGSVDLAALGIDSKDLVQGTASKTYKLNYSVNSIYNAVPEIAGAYTDFDDRVLLSFSDKYDSDIYRVAIKSGKDVNYVEFDSANKKDQALIAKNNTSVTITLDQDFLKAQGCLVPELDQKYSFSVQLKKRPVNLVDGSKELETVLESKESKALTYTPFAAWKNAPDITYASQTADGQITLRWDHDDNDLGCEYKIVRYEKILGVKKGETELGRTDKREFTVKDLMNGKYIFAVIPVYSREDGLASEEVEVELKNNWVIAPALDYSQGDKGKVILKWASAPGVESYHVIVSAGSGSLLRFVNLDFNKYTEFDVPAKTGDIEYIFTYNDPIDPDNGVKLKFEIYGVRHAANGTEQKSATTKQVVIVR